MSFLGKFLVELDDLSRAFANYRNDRFLCRVDPAKKFLLFVLVATIISFSERIYFIVLVILVNALFAYFSSISMKGFLKKIVYPFPIIIPIIYLPLIIGLDFYPLAIHINERYLFQATLLALKVSAAISTLYLFTQTTNLLDFIQRLTSIGIPKKIVMMFVLTFLYIGVFSREVFKILLARKSRWFGGKYREFLKVFSSIPGLLILRAFERGERLFWGIRSRTIFSNIQTWGSSKTYKGGLKNLIIAILVYCLIIFFTKPI